MEISRRTLLQTAAALPVLAAQAVKRPNILLLFPDQLRFDWTQANRELPVRTPNLEALASRGVRFTNAIVPSPLCAPSRACLAAGKEYERCGVASNAEDYPLDQTTYYKLLRDAGYHVAGCGKLDLSKRSHLWGLDGRARMNEWGFSDMVNNAGKFDAIAASAQEPKDPYMAYLYRRGLAQAHIADFRRRQKAGYADTEITPLDEEAYCDNWLSQNGVNLLRNAPKEKPWHLAINFTGPHNPMDITARMEKLCRDRKYPQPNQPAEYTPEVHVAIRQNYTAMVENIDRWTGIFLNEVKARGELDNTIVVFSSDHGEMLGDHGRWGKSVPWQPSVGVPLVVAGPGITRNHVSESLVSVMDLAATFLDYAAVPRPVDMDSQSLRPVLEKKSRTHREVVRSGLNRWRTVRDSQYKLVRGFGVTDAPPMLFDLLADPLENRNIAANAPDVVKRLSQAL